MYTSISLIDVFFLYLVFSFLNYFIRAGAKQRSVYSYYTNNEFFANKLSCNEDFCVSGSSEDENEETSDSSESYNIINAAKKRPLF